MNYTLFVVRDYLAFIFTVPMLILFALLFWIKRRLNLDVDQIQKNPRLLLSQPWLWPLVLVVGLFIVLDFLYHVFVGTWLFWDRPKLLSKPREWLFTDRLQGYDTDPAMASFIDRFKRTLNENDPGHV